MNHIYLGVQFLALSLFTWPTGAFAQQVSPAAGNAQVSGTPAAAAQLPRLVKFSGAVKDANGKPLSSVTGIAFALYQDREGGTPLWIENQNVQPDAAGRYTVWLGSTKNDGVPVELFASGQARWLGVQVESEPEQARVLLAAVPYALKAGDADTLGGRPASAYLLAGAPAAAPPSEAAQPAQSAVAVLPSFTSGGSANYIAKFTDTAGDVGNSVLYQNGASIGINTTTTLDVLDVAGSITAEVDGGPASGPALDLRNTPSTGFGIGSVNFYTYPGQTVPSAQWQAKDIGGFTASQTLYTAGSLNQRNQPLIPRLTVMGGTGNVGIGTTTPVAPLEVNGNAQVDGNLTMKGLIAFGSGQTFPGAGGGSGTVTSVTAGTGLTASPNPITSSGTLSIATGGVGNAMLANPSLTVLPGTDLTGGGAVALGGSTTLNLDTTKVPQLNSANTFTGNQTVNGTVTGTQLASSVASGAAPLVVSSTTQVNNLNASLLGGFSASSFQPAGAYATLGANTFTANQTVNGNLSATGVVTGSSFNIGSNLFAFGSLSNGSAYLGFSGNFATGLNNTAVGALALYYNTASYNTAIGEAALGDNSQGQYNTASGAQALLANQTGGSNTASGAQALYLNSTGHDNTANGATALYHNTIGIYNTATGSQALYYNNDTDDNTATGYQALYYNVGNFSTADGFQALAFNTTGWSNTAVGYQALLGTTTGWNNTCIGSNCSASDGVSNATAIGAHAVVGQSNSLVLGGTGQYAVKVGIGTPAPSNILTIAQGAGHPLSDGWDTFSSRRWKTNIHTLDGALAKVEQLRGVSYDLKSNGKHEVGVIAEEVGAVVPEVVTWEQDGQDARSVDYGRLTALLIEAAKEQQALIRKQQAQIKAQQMQIQAERKRGDAQQARIARLVSQVKEIQAVQASLIASHGADTQVHTAALHAPPDGR